MKPRVLMQTKRFALVEENVRSDHRGKKRRVYRIRMLGHHTSEDLQRMNRLIDPLHNRGSTRTKRFRKLATAEQAFMILILGWE